MAGETVKVEYDGPVQGWLEYYLESNAFARPEDVIADGAEAGYSEAAIYEAADSAGVIQNADFTGSDGPGTGWALPLSYHEKTKADWDRAVAEGRVGAPVPMFPLSGEQLAKKLGITLPPDDAEAPQIRVSTNGQATSSGTVPPGLPQRVLDALAIKTPRDAGGRSKDLHRIRAACLDSGLTYDEMCFVVRIRSDLIAKLAEVGGDDDWRDWRKIVDDRQNLRWIDNLRVAAPPQSEDIGVIDTGEPDYAAAAFEVRVTEELSKQRVRQEARRRLDAEGRPPIVVPPVRSLTDLLAEPDTPTKYRIGAVAPQAARIICSAQYKAGKTTLVGNLGRALVDSDPFLGAFTVHTPAQRLVLIDDEMSENMLRLWLREQGIRNTDAVADVISLRGRVGAFDLLDDRRRDEWATRLRDVGCDYLILDCLRPVLDALGLDENHDAGKFLVHFDALLADAGIGDAALVHHMGHSGERARGDSRLQDWPDAIWRLVRDPDDPMLRYFTALGRDVTVPEGRLAFDPLTRRLTYVAGSRVDAKTEAAWPAIVRLLAENPDGLSKSAIEKDLAADDHPRSAVRDALKRGVDGGVLRQEKGTAKGATNAHLHSIAYPCSACRWPVTTQRERHESCPPEPEGMPL